MILEAAKKYNIDLKESYLIGDHKRDIDAANSVNVKSFLLTNEFCIKDHKVKSICQALDQIL